MAGIGLICCVNKIPGGRAVFPPAYLGIISTIPGFKWKAEEVGGAWGGGGGGIILYITIPCTTTIFLPCNIFQLRLLLCTEMSSIGDFTPVSNSLGNFTAVSNSLEGFSLGETAL